MASLPFPLHHHKDLWSDLSASLSVLSVAQYVRGDKEMQDSNGEVRMNKKQTLGLVIKILTLVRHVV